MEVKMNVAIFWDFDNVTLPSWCSPAEAAKQIETTVSTKFGSIVGQRLYFDYKNLAKCSTDDGSTSNNRFGELYLTGFDLINNPTRNSKKTMDKRLISDMFTFGWDSMMRRNSISDEQQKPCIVVLTSDGDYSYSLAKLKDRGVHIVVIHDKNCSSVKILRNSTNFTMSLENEVVADPPMMIHQEVVDSPAVEVMSNNDSKASSSVCLEGDTQDSLDNRIEKEALTPTPLKAKVKREDSPAVEAMSKNDSKASSSVRLAGDTQDSLDNRIEKEALTPTPLKAKVKREDSPAVEAMSKNDSKASSSVCLAEDTQDSLDNRIEKEALTPAPLKAKVKREADIQDSSENTTNEGNRLLEDYSNQPNERIIEDQFPQIHGTDKNPPIKQEIVDSEKLDKPSDSERISEPLNKDKEDYHVHEKKNLNKLPDTTFMLSTSSTMFEKSIEKQDNYESTNVVTRKRKRIPISEESTEFPDVSTNFQRTHSLNFSHLYLFNLPPTAEVNEIVVILEQDYGAQVQRVVLNPPKFSCNPCSAHVILVREQDGKRLIGLSKSKLLYYNNRIICAVKNKNLPSDKSTMNPDKSFCHEKSTCGVSQNLVNTFQLPLEKYVSSSELARFCECLHECQIKHSSSIHCTAQRCWVGATQFNYSFKTFSERKYAKLSKDTIKIMKRVLLDQAITKKYIIIARRKLGIPDLFIVVNWFQNQGRYEDLSTESYFRLTKKGYHFFSKLIDEKSFNKGYPFPSVKTPYQGRYHTYVSQEKAVGKKNPSGVYEQVNAALSSSGLPSSKFIDKSICRQKRTNGTTKKFAWKEFENIKFSSLDLLEQDIIKHKRNLNMALLENNADEALMIQKQIKDSETLRDFFSTISHLDNKLGQAVARKDFSEADSIYMEIEKMKEKSKFFNGVL